MYCFGISASIPIGREIWCVPYAGFFCVYNSLDIEPVISQVSISGSILRPKIGESQLQSQHQYSNFKSLDSSLYIKT